VVQKKKKNIAIDEANLGGNVEEKRSKLQQLPDRSSRNIRFAKTTAGMLCK
jgi:hypothetical protein